MATLNWQNVQTPSFGGSLEGLRLFGSLIGNATGGLSDALGGFQRAQQTDAQQRALTAAQGFTDPVAYQRALASGQVTQGIDPSFLTPAALEALQSRSSTLLNQATTNQRLAQDQYTFGRTQDENQRMDAARPSAAALLQTSLGAPVSPELAAMPTGELVALARESQSLESGGLRNKATRTDMDLSEQQRNAARTAEGILQTDMPAIVSTDAARKYLVESSQPPEVKKILQSRLESQFGPLFGPVVGTTGTAAPTTTGARAGSVSSGSAAAPALLSGAASSPIDVSKIFDVGVLGQESGYKQFKADGTPLLSPKGATGIAQVMPATGPEAARLAGLPWDENRFKNDKEYNAAIGKAYFNKQVTDFGGDPQKALAAYNAGPGAMRTAERKAAEAGNPGDWLKYLPEETQKYVPSVMTRLGTDPAAALTAAAQPQATQRSLGAASDALGLAAIENAGGNFYVGRLAEAAKSNASRGEVLASLMSGDFKGGNEREVNDAISRVMRDAKVPAAVAGEMVKESMDISRLDAALPSWLGGGGRNINEEALNQQIKQWSAAGGPRDVLARGRDISLTGEELNAAKAAADSAKAELAAIKKRAESVPAVAAQIPEFQKKVNAANAAVLLAQSAIGTRNMQGSVQRPPEQQSAAPDAPAPVSDIEEQLIAANARAAKLPLASQERAAVLNEIRQLQMQRAAERPRVLGIF